VSHVSVVGCQVEVAAPGRSLILRSHTECGVSECDFEASIMRPYPRGAAAPLKKKYSKLRRLQNPWITSVRIFGKDSEVQARFLPNRYLQGHCPTDTIRAAFETVRLEAP
jgi:hypothetical protein